MIVDTFQAVPVLRKADDKDDVKLPTYATWLPEDNKFTRKGWYVIFCDPTLPEAPDADLERDTKFEDLGNPDFGELDPEAE